MKVTFCSALGIMIALSAAAVFHYQDDINVYFMGLFRDLARLKARHRRMGNDKAILSASDLKHLLLRQDDADPLKEVLDISEQEGSEKTNLHTMPVYSEEELFEFGNGKDGKPILIAIFGRVYDVSTGAKFYGPDGNYNLFAGRDVTRAMSTGCLVESCLGVKSRKNVVFSEAQLSEAKKWLAFFETHDSYAHVGMLDDGASLEDLMEKLLDEYLEQS
eukprot:CAMPEP_0113947084 /NCGR_PEP_ID=MMETSP1339-20121228/62157_1 /TAXON_ID=94617 /ORGANISM="Fibrocapsa japonica" /LENGTH=217 /DNA_ID=CAMNT_0000953491 /DNA_START=106 /DNA_END=759 /DNA_ORIENTATION=+ /assembly_acc=CAM_ASM_000762